jgi:hypothetical protein
MRNKLLQQISKLNDKNQEMYVKSYLFSWLNDQYLSTSKEISEDVLPERDDEY